MAVTLINYLITKDPNSYFLGMIAHLVGLFLTELFLRMRNKNDDKDTVTSKVWFFIEIINMAFSKSGVIIGDRER